MPDPSYTAGLEELRKLKERLAHLEAIAAASPTAPAPLTFEAVRHLSRTEINRRWPEVQAALAAGPTPPAPPSDPAPSQRPVDAAERAAELRREMFGAPTPPAPADPPGPPALTTAEIRKMTPDAINADWDRVSEVLKGSTR